MMSTGILTLLFLISIVFIGSISIIFVRIICKIYMRFHGGKLLGRYYCFYYSDKQIIGDKSAERLAKMAYPAYTDPSFDDYQERLDENRLPLHLLINWTRTIAEDLSEHPSPVLRVKNWFAFFDRTW